MVTIYDLLEVSETASKEEIEKAYEKMLVKYQTNPNLDTSENKDNEFILNKLKVAYEILTNDEKRRRYDNDLAKKRSEELLNNISRKNELVQNEEEVQTSNNVSIEKENYENNYDDEFDDDIQEDVELTAEEKRKLKKAAENEFKKNLRKAEKAERAYNKAYEDAYNQYFGKSSFRINLERKLRKIRNILLVIAAVIVICFICWLIPPSRNQLIDLYNNNVIVKAIVDIIKGIIFAIFGINKK